MCFVGPRRHAIIICNGKYDDPALPTIKGVAADHEALTRVLSDPSAGFVVTSLYEQGLRAARLVIAKVCRDAGPDDTILFYYSGYGLLDADSLYLPLKDSRAEYPAATALESDFVLGALRESKCRRIVVLIDTCHAGAFFNRNRELPDGLFAITACGADESTADSVEGGAFTRALLDALQRPETDRDDDGWVTIDDIHEYVVTNTQRAPNSGPPQKWIWNARTPIYLSKVPARVFLSYCQDDLDYAMRLKAGLEAFGLAVWFDREGIRSGDWKRRVTENVSRARCLLLLLTPASFRSDAVKREVEFAIHKGVSIVPVTIGEVEQHQLPDWYAFQCGSILRCVIDPKNFDTSIARIIAAVRDRPLRQSQS